MEIRILNMPDALTHTRVLHVTPLDGRTVGSIAFHSNRIYDLNLRIG